jgi:hypothetical protein
MGCRAVQLLVAFRAIFLLLCWKASASFASSLATSQSNLDSVSGSISLSSSIATAGVPLTFSVKSADANAILCVQVRDPSLRLLKSFIGSFEFTGSFSVDTALKYSVESYTLRSGGLNFSSSSFPFGRFHEGPFSSTIKNVQLSYGDSLRPFVRWVGMLKGPCTGVFSLNVTSSYPYALRINSTLLIDNLDLRAVGLSSAIVSLHVVESSFLDIEVLSHVI